MATLPILVNIISSLMLASVIFMISRRGLYTCIIFFTLHSALLSLAILAVAVGMGEPPLYVGFISTIILKVIIVPAALYWMIKEIKIKREVDFYINTTVSLLAAVLMTVFSFYLVQNISNHVSAISETALVFAFAMILIGFFMVISRTQAVTQMLGFLIMENSLFLLITMTTFGIPLFIEAGISFDVVVALLIMGIFLFRINQTFAHINVSELRGDRE